jgi:HD-GYP domain-containing protein (c-di-GMP phosphodiesterase class II)
MNLNQQFESPSLAVGMDASANRATRESRQQLGQEAAMAVHVILRHARSYDERNAVFAKPMLQLVQAIASLLQTDGGFELRFSRDGVWANRQSLRLDAGTRAALQAVHLELAARGVAGLSAARLPPEADLRALVALLRSPRRAEPAASPQPAPVFVSLRLLAARPEEAARATESPLEQRLARAWSSAALFAARTIAQLRAGGEVPPSWAASHLVRELVDLQQLAPRAFLELARVRADADAYWGAHAANVAVLAISFGGRLGLSRRRRHDLGMSALFHDVGMAAMPAGLLAKPAAFDEGERRTVAASPLLGARVLLRERETHAAALERALAAYECHLDLDAPGGEPREIGFCGRVVAICESFDALTSPRPHRGALSPRAALEEMRTSLAGRFDAELLGLFAGGLTPWC